MKKLSTIVTAILLCYILFTGYNSFNKTGEPKSNGVRVYKDSDRGVLLVNPSFMLYPGGGMQKEEIRITSHPHVPDILFAAGRTYFVTAQGENTGVYVSTNGGANWYGWDTINVWINIWHSGNVFPIINNNGTFVLGFTRYLQYLINSTNYGETFSWLITPGRTRASLSVDDSPKSPYYGRVYSAWKNYQTGSGPERNIVEISYTTDDGHTWGPIYSFDTTALPYRYEKAKLGIGPYGELYTCWAKVDYSQSNVVETSIEYSNSTNGGATWHRGNMSISGTGRSSTFGPHHVYVDSYPRIAVDKSGGSRDGWVYIVCTQRYGDAQDSADVMLKRSSDKGNTWSNWIRVNQDSPGTGRVQLAPEIAIDKYGGIDIVYFDNRETALDSAKIFMSRSVDGGDTWLDIPVSDHAFKPGDIGDYLSSIGITALGNKLFTTWFSTKSGSHKFWAASIVIDSTSSVSTISSEIPSEYKLSQNYPNPFNPSTKITFSLPTNDHVSLKVFDITGKEVAVLVNESLNPGLYEVRFDAENLPSGMYFYRLTSDNFSETKKMVVIK